MITHWDEPVFPDGPADLFYARIRCLWECYRDTCLADFWIQRMQGKTTAWLCRMEGTVTVCGVPPADWAELAGFVSFLGPREVFGPPEMELCASTLAAQGVLLRCARLYPSPAACPDMEMVKNPSAGRVYDLLSQCRSDTLTLPDRDGFLSDYARRIRRGVGRSRLVRVDGADVASAMTTAQAPGLAVLGGIAVLPQQRERGLATALIASMTQELLQEGRQVLLATSGDRLTRFYKARGFAICGGWRRYRLE